MLIDTDFGEEALGALADSPRWRSEGLSTNVTVVAEGEDHLLASSGGLNLYVREEGSSTIHQRVEARFRFGLAGTMGVVARFVDSFNFVVLQISNADRTATLIEVVDGVERSCGTMLWGGVGEGASLRLEVLGRRARCWYEQADRAVSDRPPDLGADLTWQPPGEWGIYLDGGGTMRIMAFGARDIPAVVMPAPAVTHTSADGLNLVAVTVDLIGVSAQARDIEWEVYPADAADFPEACRDFTLPVASRTLWLRPGFSYDVRARERLADGSLGAWTAFDRLVLDGEKSGVLVAVVPSVEFPEVTADYVLPREQTASVLATVSDAGNERVQSRWARPRNKWSLVFRNREHDECQALIDFFEDRRAKKEAFAWTHPTTGERYALRFDADDYEIRYDSHGEGSIAQLSFEVIEVHIGQISTVVIGGGMAPRRPIVLDSDCLVQWHNGLAALAGAAAQVRDRPTGTLLSAEEYNALSESVAGMSQTLYVADGSDPDSYVNHVHQMVATDADVTQERLEGLRQGLQRMRFLRAALNWGTHCNVSASVTKDVWTDDDDIDVAINHLSAVWGTTDWQQIDDYTLSATVGTGSTGLYLFRITRGATNLEVEARSANCQPTFDFTGYAGARSAGVFIKAVATDPAGNGAQVDVPLRTFHDVFNAGAGRWTRLASLRQDIMGSDWLGDVLPSLGSLVSGTVEFDDTTGVTAGTKRADVPAMDGQTLTVSNEHRTGIVDADPVAFAADAGAGGAAFSSLTYQNVSAIDLSGGVGHGWRVRGQKATTQVAFKSCLSSSAGQAAFLIEQTAGRVWFSMVACDSAYRIDATIGDVVFDASSGDIELVGLAGRTIRNCWINRHDGQYKDLNGIGINVIRGLPLDLTVAPAVPMARPAEYPEAGETMVLSWLLKDGCVLIEVDSMVECGYITGSGDGSDDPGGGTGSCEAPPEASSGLSIVGYVPAWTADFEWDDVLQGGNYDEKVFDGSLEQASAYIWEWNAVGGLGASHWISVNVHLWLDLPLCCWRLTITWDTGISGYIYPVPLQATKPIGDGPRGTYTVDTLDFDGWPSTFTVS